MTSYVGGFPALGGISAENLSAVELRVISNLIQAQSGAQQQDELRVISNLLQAQSGAQQQDELRILRNDQAFELGIVPPVVPGN